MRTFAQQQAKPENRVASSARSNMAALTPAYQPGNLQEHESEASPHTRGSRLEPHWGHHFSRVRIHSDAEAVRASAPVLRRKCAACAKEDEEEKGTLHRSPAPGAVSAPVLRRKCAACAKEDEEEKGTLHRSAAPGAPPATAPPIVHQVLDSPGNALDPGVRSAMETRFGRDLGHVRVHTDAGSAESAAAVHAQAYTVGSHIVFGAGRYSPSSAAGLQLMAHELVHVAQQGDARVHGAGTIPIGAPDTPQEHEADALSSRLHLPPPVSPSAAASPSLQRQPDAESHTTWPRWHETEFRERIAKIGGPSDGKTADSKWPAFRAYLCGLSKERAQSLHGRWNPNAPGLQPSPGHPLGTDDFAAYIKIKFPANYSNIFAVLASRAADTRPAECDAKPQEKQPSAKAATSRGALEIAGEEAAAVGQKIPTTEKYRQLTCVVQSGGCAHSLPGGAPDESTYKNANDICKRTTGYQGDPIMPTEEECEKFKEVTPISVARVEQLKELLTVYEHLVKAGAFSQAEMGPIEQQIQETCRTLSEFSPIDCSPKPATPSEEPAPAPEPVASAGKDKPAQASAGAMAIPAAANALRTAAPLTVARMNIVAMFLAVAAAGTYIAVTHEQRVRAAGMLEILIMLLLRATGEYAKLAKKLKITKTVDKTDDKPKPKKDPDKKTKPEDPPWPVPSCPTGKTKDDPISMIWFKPLSEYKNPIYLFGQPYYRNRKKRLPGKGEEIGVDNWPQEKQEPFQRVATPDAGEKERFRKVLESEGFDWKDLDADHVMDLNFSGDDAFSNLWPLDAQVNRYAGTWHPGQPVCYSQPWDPLRSPIIEALGSSTLAGRWFIASSTWNLKKAK